MYFVSAADYIRSELGWTGDDHSFASRIQWGGSHEALDTLLYRDIYVAGADKELRELPRAEICGLTPVSAFKLVTCTRWRRPFTVSNHYECLQQPLQHPYLPSLLVEKKQRERGEPKYDYFPLERVFVRACSCLDVCKRTKVYYCLLSDSFVTETVRRCPEEVQQELIDWDTAL